MTDEEKSLSSCDSLSKEEIPCTSWPFNTDWVNRWAYWDEAFSKEECEKIIEIGNGKTMHKAATGGGVVSDIRKSEVSWLYPSDELEWAYQRMTHIVNNLNERFFKFDLFGAAEGMQFTRYVAPNGNYGKHIDSSTGWLVRKLSFTLQLSDPADYEGGDLCIYDGEEPEVMEKKQGRVVVFPSYSMHEVTPVTKGTRYSLVCWITGKPFK